MALWRGKQSFPCSFRNSDLKYVAFHILTAIQLLNWSTSNYLDPRINLCVPFFLFWNMCVPDNVTQTHIHLGLAYSCSLSFYTMSILLGNFLGSIKEATYDFISDILKCQGNNIDFFSLNIAFKSTSSHSQQLYNLVQCFSFTGKHDYGQHSNHASESAVGYLAVAVRMQVSVTL